MRTDDQRGAENPTSAGDSKSAPTAVSEHQRHIGKVLIVVALAVLFFLVLSGALIVWMFYSKQSDVPITVASFRADYQENSPRAGWRYLWNPAGEIGKTTNYVPLVWNGSAYGPNDNPERPQPGPAHYVRISKSGGHPAHGKPQRGDIDTYVIYAFTVTNRGFYAVTNSYIIRSDGKLNGDVNLRLYVNEILVGPEITCDSKTPVPFDRPLGDLNPGDSIYVAVGPNGMDRNDNFQIDFSLNFSKPKKNR